MRELIIQKPEREQTLETGLRHGTLTVLIAGLSPEITTYRIDGEYKDNRRPAVKEILKEYAEILGVVVPEILPCVGFNQRNPHHVHDVWGHSAEVVANIEPTPLLR
jgi:hypothetical protein